jgi:xylitol oxidase
MDKREFLKTSGVILAGSALSRFSSGEAFAGSGSAPAGAAARTNWAGNLTYSAKQLDEPSSVAEVQQLIKSRTPVKALGARHSINTIADTTGDQISLVQHVDGMTLDPDHHTVTVGGGVKYGLLAPWLDQQGYAVHNLASLPHVSVIGACATATHGSGIRNGNLSTAVVGLEMVTGTGDVVELSRDKDGDRFDGMVVALGALGVVTKVTLKVLPRFEMYQAVYQNLSFDQLEKNLDTIFGSGYSVSLFTDWQHHRATQVWLKKTLPAGADTKNPVQLPPEFYGATLAKEKLHPITGHPADACTDQMGIPGPWYERLPHFKMNFTPSSGQELQTEYFVPREHGYEAILAVEKLRDEITPHLFVTELRTIDADNLWMSPCHQRPAMTVHFTWKPEWPAVRQILPKIEAQLKPFAVRPHWAKLFTIPAAQIQAQYPRLADFRGLVKEYDPQGRFRNAFLDTNIYG